VLRAAHGIAYDERSQGTLQLFRKRKQLDGVGEDIEVLKRFGVPFEVLDREGTLRFVDAPEVDRTFERAVTLTVTAAELPELAKQVDRGLGGLGGGNAGGGLLGRLFRR